MVGLTREDEELAKLLEHLDKAYCMEISATKNKTNNSSSINKEMKVNGQKLETVTSLKYPSSVVSNKGSKQEMPLG